MSYRSGFAESETQKKKPAVRWRVLDTLVLLRILCFFFGFGSEWTGSEWTGSEWTLSEETVIRHQGRGATGFGSDRTLP